MTMIRILQYPDPRLGTVAEKVTEFGDALQKIIDDMVETLYKTENCAGLAATQLDFENPQAISVMDHTPDKKGLVVVVNPEVIEQEGEVCEPEGCMSIGGNTYLAVPRAEKVKVRALDRLGKAFELEADGFQAKLLQHEIDHLNGIIFIDKLSRLKRSRVDARIKKWQKQQDE